MRTRTTYTVVKKTDGREVVIDAGLDSPIQIHQRVHFVRLGDEVIHPETKEKLGKLEQLLAIGFVAHIQEHITIVTDREPDSSTIALRSPLLKLSQAVMDSTYRQPFEDVREGDIGVVYA